MPRYLLLLGSNIEPEVHLPRALRNLEARFEVRDASRVIESEAVGCDGAPLFHNQAVVLRSDLDSDGLRDQLRALEAEHGRERGEEPNAPRTLDVDIIFALAASDAVADDPVPDERPLDHHYGAVALADVLPEAIVAGRSLAAHRDALGEPSEPFRLIEFHDEAVPEA